MRIQLISDLHLETEVGVASLILTRDLADSPLGGRALKSNGTLERQHLEALTRLLPQ